MNESVISRNITCIQYTWEEWNKNKVEIAALASYRKIRTKREVRELACPFKLADSTPHCKEKVWIYGAPPISITSCNMSIERYTNCRVHALKGYVLSIIRQRLEITFLAGKSSIVSVNNASPIDHITLIICMNNRPQIILYNGMNHNKSEKCTVMRQYPGLFHSIKVLSVIRLTLRFLFVQ